ncbi:MAG: HdeD family acid-resistance protein [Rhizobiaceae bacterium]|nr:HdeD family acid-resistance protein [Rhizobiaceae bacterium]
MATDVSKSIGGSDGELRTKWGWFVALGVLMLIAGVIAFGNILFATVVSVFYVGVLMIVAGVFEIIHAFGVKTWGGFFWWLLSGILYTIAGYVAFTNPLLAAAVMTLLLAATLIASGIIRIWLGARSRSGWIIAAGVVTALAGIVIAIGWPVNSLFILGLFLAFDLVFQGIGFIFYGFALKR